MRQVRLIGVTLVLLSALFGMLYASAAERRKLRVLDAWIELIELIRGQIDCFLKPICDILRMTDKQLLSSLSSNSPPQELSDLLTSSAPFLDGECKRHLSSLVRVLGEGYKDDQLRACDYCLSHLRSRREELGAQLPAKLKTQCTLILCAAIGLALVLW